jgi:hypothetical protein
MMHRLILLTLLLSGPLSATLATEAASQTSPLPDSPVASRATIGPKLTDRTPSQVIVVENMQDNLDRKAREAKVEKHDAENLDVQVRAATAAERQVIVAWAALAISLLGTIGVLLALRESRRGLKLSLDASRAYQRAERAWVAISRINFTHVDGRNESGPVSGVTFTSFWANAGHTPAIQCSTHTQLKMLGPNEAATPPVFVSEPDPLERATTMVPGITVSSPDQFLRDNDVELLKNRKLRVFLYARATYRDVFDRAEQRHSEHCMEITYAGIAVDQGTGVGNDQFSFSAVGSQNTAS